MIRADLDGESFMTKCPLDGSPDITVYCYKCDVDTGIELYVGTCTEDGPTGTSTSKKP